MKAAFVKHICAEKGRRDSSTPSHRPWSLPGDGGWGTALHRQGQCPSRCWPGPGKVPGSTRSSSGHSAGVRGKAELFWTCPPPAGTRWAQESPPEGALGDSQSPGETSAIGSTSDFHKLWEEAPAISFAELYLQLTEVNEPIPLCKSSTKFRQKS